MVTTTESAQKTEEETAGELVAGQVNALAGDSAFNVYYVDKPPYAGASEIVGPLLEPEPIGIAFRKDDAGRKEAVAAAIDAMYADGTMKAILAKWGLTTPSSCSSRRVAPSGLRPPPVAPHRSRDGTRTERRGPFASRQMPCSRLR